MSKVNDDFRPDNTQSGIDKALQHSVMLREKSGLLRTQMLHEWNIGMKNTYSTNEEAAHPRRLFYYIDWLLYLPAVSATGYGLCFCACELFHGWFVLI